MRAYTQEISALESVRYVAPRPQHVTIKNSYGGNQTVKLNAGDQITNTNGIITVKRAQNELGRNL